LCLIFICMKNINKEEFIQTCKNAESMAQASVKLNMHFNTFKRYAEKFECYNPNQSGKGMHKPSGKIIPLKEILEGKHPQYQTFKLKNRLIKEGIIKNECSICHISSWQNKQLNVELDHIDGNRTNHTIKNLRMLCPNCHSQTDTYRSKNRNNLC